MLWVFIASIILVAPFAILMGHAKLANDLLIAVGVALVLYLLAVLFKLERGQQKSFFVCLVLMLASIAFWALYQQMGMSITLFTARDVNLTIFGHYSIPASTASSLNGIFIMLLTPVIIRTWKGLNKRGLEPGYVGKFAFGILCVALGFWALSVGAKTVHGTHAASFWFIVASYFLQTVGELSLSPIGLAMISELAPERMRGMMMGAWFFAIAAATVVAGQLSKLASIPEALQVGHLSAPIYSHAFFEDGAITIAVAAVLVILSKPLRAMLPAKNR